MKNRSLPSPATLLALVALFAALGGVAYAGAKIGTSKLKNGAVTKQKLAKGAVTGKAIADDAVTGKQINESTLGKVPSAATADAAGSAGGLVPQKFSARIAPGTGIATIATVGTLQVQFGCASGSPQFRVVPAQGAPPQTTRAAAMLLDDQTVTQGQGTLPAGGIDVLDGTEGGFSSNGTVDSLTDTGGVTSIQWAARSTSAIPTPNPDGNRCLLWGTGLSG